MNNNLALKPDPVPVVACTVSQDITQFDLLITDMEAELGERWGDLDFRDTLAFLEQPEASALQFLVIALKFKDDAGIELVSLITRRARALGIRTFLVIEEIDSATNEMLSDKGFNAVLPYPLPENALHQALLNENKTATIALKPPSSTSGSNLPIVNNQRDRSGAVICVHGLSGGVGATTFAVNLAWELAFVGTHSPSVCLIDMDIQIGSVSTYLDLPRRDIVYEILTEPHRIDRESFLQALHHIDGKLAMFTAPREILPLDIVGPDEIASLLKTASDCYDVVIVDMPTTLVTWTEAALRASDIYFSVLERDMRSVQNTLRFLNLLKAESLPDQSIRYVMNRAPKFSDLQGRSRIRKLSESLNINIELMLPDGLKPVVQAGDQGSPLAESAPRNPLRREIRRLAESLTQRLATAGIAA